MSFPCYPEYKDSGVEWVGEVPAHWDIKRVRHVTQCMDGKRIPLNSEQRADKRGSIPYWGANAIMDFVDEALFDEPLILLGEDGAPFLDPLRPVAFYSSGPVWPNNHVHVLRPDHQPLARYIVHCLNSADYSQYIDGSTRDKLTQSAMNSIPLPWPPFVEAMAIWEFLDRETAKIDALVAEQEKLVALLKEKRQAVISHAVTKGLAPAVPMKDSGIEWLGEVPAHWEVSAIKHIVSTPVTDGPHETPNFPDEGIPFVSAEAVSSGSIDFSKIRGFISEIDHLRYSEKCRPQRGDIFMVKSGATTGVTAIVETDIEFNIWSPLAVIRCGKRALPRFVLNFMRSKNFQEAVTLNWSFGTQQNIGMGVIENLSVTVPPVKEQQQIADFLGYESDKFDVLTAEAEKGIALLKERRSALISAAVTGKIDVRGVAEQVESASHETAGLPA